MNNKLMFDGNELPINVWESKYADKGETHYNQMHERLAKKFAEKELEILSNEDYSNIDNLSNLGKEIVKRRKNQTLEELTKEIQSYFKDFKYIVPQGSIMYGLGKKGVYVSLSNCFFIGSPRADSYSAIMEVDEQIVQLSKRRGGVGVDISTLRPNNAEVSNSAGSSTGAVSFLERYSNSIREVGQSGRRGALLCSLSINHPDAEEFATIKSDKSYRS